MFKLYKPNKFITRPHLTILQMNLKENCKVVSFIWHFIHNEIVTSITNTCYNGFVDKEGKT
jgi:hypothetical protein